MATEPRPPNHRPDQGLGLSKLATLGTEIGLTVSVLALIGWWLDERWGTTPWLTLSGVAMATIGLTYKLLRLSASMDDQRKPANQRKPDDQRKP